MSALVDAWQAALAAEHRAYFGYGLLGPQLPANHQPLAHTDQTAHQTLRDATSAAIAAAGLAPVEPAADYPLGAVTNGSDAITLAAGLEDSCATAWRYLYARAATTSGARAPRLRPSAQRALTASAVRAALWRRMLDPATATEPFPGI